MSVPKRKKLVVYQLTQQDRSTIKKWLNQEITYSEVARAFGMTDSNARSYITVFLRQMYNEGRFIFNDK